MTKTVTLGEICDKISNCNPSVKFGSSPFSYLDIASLDRETKKLTSASKVIGMEAPSRARQLVHANDILVSTVRPNLNAVAKVTFEYDSAVASTGFCVLRPKKNITDSDYIFYWAQAKPFVRELVEKATGANYPAVSDSIIKNTKLPLPSLPRQRQIAAILDQADALRQKDRQLLNYYDQLAQSTFMDLFGDPVSNEKGWENVKAGSVIAKIVAGDSYGGEERPLKTNELGVLKVSAVTSGRFKSTEYKAVPKSALKKKVIFPKKGDLLFSRANTRELVAATCIVDKDYDTVFLPDKLWRIDLDHDRCNSLFLKTLLSQKTFRYELTKTATGTSGSMLNISMDKLRGLLIWLPPLSLQQHFVSILERIERQKAIVQQQITASESLFQRLLQDNFGD